MNHRKSVGIVLLALATGACTVPKDEDFLIGVLERDRIELVASATEPLFELTVREGELVSRGQVLARLDDRRAAARLAAAEAAVRRAEAVIAELERGARSERVAGLKAELSADRAELAQAGLDHRRARELVSSRVMPQGELDRAKTRLDTARASLREHRAELDEMTVGATAEELSQARADLDAAAAEVASLRVDFERMTLRSPVDGRVDALPYEVGELPGTGATIVVLLSNAMPHVRAYLPETRFASARVGMAATIEVDGLDVRFDGCLRFLSHEAAFTPHYALSEHDRHRLAFLMEVDLPGADAASLPSGLPVRVRLHPDRLACRETQEGRSSER
jgi:HlyD family secretion protein